MRNLGELRIADCQLPIANCRSGIQQRVKFLKIGNGQLAIGNRR